MDNDQPASTRQFAATVRPVPSTAQIASHPIHPMLVPFPIAFLIGALLSDLVFWGTGDGFWARASAWLIGAGLVGGALAAVAGLTDFLGNAAIRELREAWIHFIGNGIAVLVALANLILRLVEGSAPAVLPTGIILSAVVVVIFAVTGRLDGLGNGVSTRCRPVVIR
jgi:uncharacterized membrane protein